MASARDAAFAEVLANYKRGLGSADPLEADARALYTLATPDSGWWVDIEHPDSIASLSDYLEYDLAAAGVTTLTTAVLRSDARTVTTKAAQWIRSQVLDDGSEPLSNAMSGRAASPAVAARSAMLPADLVVRGSTGPRGARPALSTAV